MAKVHTANSWGRTTVLAVVTVALYVFAMFAWPRLAQAEYGSCNYSEGSYSSQDQSCGADTDSDPGGDLSRTGRNWQNLAFASVGLIVGASGVMFIASTLRRSKKNPRYPSTDSAAPQEHLSESNRGHASNEPVIDHSPTETPPQDEA